jgi:hypothetical protein
MPVANSALPALLLLSATTLSAQLVTRLSPATSAAFDQYIAAAEPKILEQAKMNRPLPMLGDEHRAKVRRGELAMRGVSPQNGHGVADGLIHDWVGGVFIPGVTLEKVAAILQDFDRHEQWYPEIIDSKLLKRDGPAATGSWVMRKKKVITVVLRANLDSTHQPVSAEHAYIVSRSQPVAEIRDHGSTKQSEYPAGQGHGFLWRFNGYWSLHEADGGVYAECRVISLSRDVPSGLGWIVNPFVRSMPRESIETTLRKTREAAAKA